MQLMVMSKDAPMARHQHASSWEVIGLLTARGTFSVAAKDVAVRSGSVLHVAPATDHEWKPAGTTTLVGVQLYVPPGPEQRFKTMAGDVRVAPDN